MEGVVVCGMVGDAGWQGEGQMVGRERWGEADGDGEAAVGGRKPLGAMHVKVPKTHDGCGRCGDAIRTQEKAHGNLCFGLPKTLPFKTNAQFNIF